LGAQEIQLKGYRVMGFIKLKPIVFMATIVVGVSACQTTEMKKLETPEANANWVEIMADKNGNTEYLAYDLISEHDAFVYYWILIDFIKPTKWGDLSAKSYYQGDCSKFGSRVLKYIFHKQAMGKGQESVEDAVDPKWHYPRQPPKSLAGFTLRRVCNHVK
jgi:hypothetical protein